MSLILAVIALSVKQDCVSSFELPRCSQESATEGFAVKGNVIVEKNRLAGIFTQWGPIFRVTFELKIDSATKLPDDWLLLLRITDDNANTNSLQAPGCHIPGVWLNGPFEVSNHMCGQSSTCLWIGNYISSNWDEIVPLNISRDRFVLIEIAQWVMDGVYVYRIYKDGKLYVQMPNYTPANFTNVNAFTSDNVHASMGKYGQMRNLEVATWDQQPTDCYISKP